MSKSRTKPLRKKPYTPPNDQEEKLVLLGTMGYLEANNNLFTYTRGKEIAAMVT